MSKVIIATIGDIIFVRPDPGDWAGQLVARATGGPYAHVRVRISPVEVVEALAHGVERNLLAFEPDAADVCAAVAWMMTTTIARRQHALSWLLAQIGNGYGFLDLVADGVQIVLPRALGARTPFLVAPSRYDCSELATRFLVLAGYAWLPDAMAMDPMRVSPNALARALGVLKP